MDLAQGDNSEETESGLKCGLTWLQGHKFV